jgi:MFS family permease
MAEAEQGTGAAAEWKRYWFLPLVAGFGYTVTQLYAYALAPFIEPIQQEFHWSRAQVMTGPAIANLPQIVLLPLIGTLVDRWGPRRVGLVGVCAVPGFFALLGIATGSLHNWWLLWAGLMLGAPWAQGSVWTSATVSRFTSGRGLALAVTLSGGAVATAVMPPLAAAIVQHFGWRHGFMVLGGCWWLLCFIPVLFLFRGAQDDSPAHRTTRAERMAAAASQPGLTMPEAVRRSAFYKLIFASLCYAIVAVGAVQQLVLIFKSLGTDTMQAAATASLVGIFALIGRLITGALLDRYPSNIVGCLGYLLPLPAFVLLLSAGTAGSSQIAAAAMLGLGLGAETECIAYLITCHFGLKRFASVMSVMFSFIAFGAAVGPLLGGRTFDKFGNYNLYMMGAVVVMAISALAILSMRNPPFAGHGH